MGFNIVSPGGVSSHVTATITLPSLTGTWTEQGVPSGNFVPMNGPGTGSPKPARSAVVASASRNDNFTFAQGAPVFVWLDAPTTPPAATALSFTLPTAEQLILTYSAECAVGGGTTFIRWLDIDVLLNGTVLSPTDNVEDAFCTSNGTASVDGWTRASITLVVPAVAGANTIQIRATIQNGTAGDSGWLGDSALIVQR
jgi:hypothetical protein